MSDLFVRKATGMVRSWSVFDAFVYAFFSINFVSDGARITENTGACRLYKSVCTGEIAQRPNKSSLACTIAANQAT